MKHFDKNGKVLKVNDSVLMPEPNENDFYSHEFVGTIVDLDDNYAIVRDDEENCVSIESDRLELYVEEHLSPEEIELLKSIVPGFPNEDFQPPFFQDGNNYPYSKIEQFKNDNPDYVEEYHGDYLVGRNFITLVDDRENVISFVLVSHSNTGGTYKCIYSDLK